MGTLKINDRMPDFCCPTPFQPELKLYDALQRVEGKTALVFLRYYGCPICQLDIREFAESYDAITAAGGQLLVVLQSDPARLAAQLTQGELPFDILCDPDQKLYKELAIEPAASMLKMMSFAALKKIIRSTKRGFKHGEYEGIEEQLPAAFLLQRDGTVLWAHYGKDVGDVPTAQELAERMK